MFTNSPRFSKLSQQVALAMETEMLQGAWRESLPGERYLAEYLQVSRRTVRAALELLRQKKLLKTRHGMGTQIVSLPAPETVPHQPRSVGLLLPETIDHLRPQTAVLIDILRAELYASGITMETHIGQRFFSGRPGGALAKLAGQFTHDCWLLTFSTRSNQEWFQARGLPVLVLGTTHDGVELPSVDIDMRATCRHAAGQLIRRGHRRIALVVPPSDRAGDQHTEDGFLEGIAASGEAKATVFRHDGSVSSLRKLVSRILEMKLRPTAIFVANPLHYLAVASILAEMRVRVPEDISLLSRDDDVFLPFLATEPSRYECSPQSRAKVAYSLVMKILGGETDREKLSAYLLPTFVPGASLAAPPKESLVS